MNVLITGENGFLGKSIVNELKVDNSIYGLSRNSKDFKISLENEIPEFKIKFDLVVHAAGRAHIMPKTKFEKQLFHDINVIGTINLLKGLEKSGFPEQFLYISSVSVYGQEYGLNIDEKHPLNAKDSYGLSKIEAEELVLEWCHKHNVVCTILRLPLVVGYNPPGNLGEMIKAIDRGYYFNIGGGKARKSMVLAEDVARFIPIIAPNGGIYNLTDGVHPCIADLSYAIAKMKIYNLPLIIAKVMGYIGNILGDKAPLNSLKIKKIISNLTFDDSRAREFGWNPQSVLEYFKSSDL